VSTEEKMPMHPYEIDVHAPPEEYAQAASEGRYEADLKACLVKLPCCGLPLPMQDGMVPDTAFLHALAGRHSCRSMEAHKALEVAEAYEPTTIAHQAWVIDQMVRCLAGPWYDAWVHAYETVEGAPRKWNVGTEPN
jgi:hypothetical protein